MTYFQNPFPAEFRASWIFAMNQKYTQSFVCPANAGRSFDLIAAWNEPVNGLYDLSGNDSDGNPTNILNIRMSVHNDDTWVNLEIDLTDNTYAALNPAPIAASMQPVQIAAILNADPVFSTYFKATLQPFPNSPYNFKIMIRSKTDYPLMKYFVINGQAEEILKFNKFAGVADIPSNFARSKVWGGDMTIDLNGDYAIVELDPSNAGGTSAVDDLVIDNAIDPKGNSLNLNSSIVKPDWEIPSSVSQILVSNIASTLLLDVNPSRNGAIFNNIGANKIYLKLGIGATSTSFTYAIPAGDSIALPTPMYTGAIEALADTAPTNINVTEY